MENEWMPWESAPMDGSTILARFANGTECPAEYWAACEYVRGGWAFEVSQCLDADISADPIQWRPLRSA